MLRRTLRELDAPVRAIVRAALRALREELPDLKQIKQLEARLSRLEHQVQRQGRQQSLSMPAPRSRRRQLARARHLMGSIAGAYIAYEPTKPGGIHKFRVDAGRGSKVVGFTRDFIADTDVEALEQLLKDSEMAVRLALTRHKPLLVSHAGIQEMEFLP